MASGTAFSGISKKEGNLTRYTQIFETFFSQKFSFHSTLLPKVLEFSIERIAFRISTVSAISGNFFGKFLYHLPLFPNVRKFLLNGKRLWFIVFPPSLPLHFYSFPSSILSFLLFSLLVLTSIFIFSLLLLIFVVAVVVVVVLLFLHFCFSSSFSSSILMFPLLPSSFFLFSLHHHHHISIVFPPPPPPPPPHFYCFPSTTTTTTFLLFSLHHHHRHISLSFPPPTPDRLYGRSEGQKNQKENKK